MAGPAAAIVAGAVTLWLAVKSNDGLVADDYYKQGLAINQDLARADQARALGMSARIGIGDDRIEVKLGSFTGGFPERIRITIVHHTRAGLDQRLVLTGNGDYAGALAPLSAGRWQIDITDEARTWRLIGVLRIPEERQLTIAPPSESQQ
jgi:hypothetical protein